MLFLFHVRDSEVGKSTDSQQQTGLIDVETRQVIGVCCINIRPRRGNADKEKEPRNALLIVGEIL